MKRLLVTTLAIVFLTGCSISSQADQSKMSTKKNIKIGFSMATIQQDRWTDDRDIFMALAKEKGASVIVQNADNDPNAQIEQIEYLLNQNIDVLVIIPQNATNLVQSVELAKKAGVPVISYDRLVLNANTDVYISFDNYSVGEKMAEAAVKAVPKGNYLLIHGSPEDHNSEMFKSGYAEYLKPYIQSGNINIIGEKSAIDWRREDAKSFVQEKLEKGVKIDAIICANDALAGGAIEALAENRLAGKVVVTGHDAELAACQRIVEGTQTVTIYKPIQVIAKKAVEIALLLARREKINASDTINDGKYNIPYIKLDVIAVDKNNMDQVVIKDGFHLREEVYQNVTENK